MGRGRGKGEGRLEEESEGENEKDEVLHGDLTQERMFCKLQMMVLYVAVIIVDPRCNWRWNAMVRSWIEPLMRMPWTLLQ